MDKRRTLTLTRQRLRGDGRRWTATRERILAAALTHPGHFDAEALRRAVNRGRGRKVSLASVYRTLPLLAECGLIAAAAGAGDQARYECALRRCHHDHLVCLACGAVSELASPALERLQERECRRHGFSPLRHQLVIEGHCRACARKRAHG